MSKIYLGNAFSLGMLPRGGKFTFTTASISPSEVPADAVSVVGHAQAAAMFSNLLGREVVMNRVTTKLVPGDVLYVGQYVGERLPEGATTLPDGAYIDWQRVVVFPETVE